MEVMNKQESEMYDELQTMSQHDLAIMFIKERNENRKLRAKNFGLEQKVKQLECKIIRKDYSKW